MCNFKSLAESEKEIKQLKGHRSKDRPLNKRETIHSVKC